MLTKTDCILLLTEQQSQGVDVGEMIQLVLKSPTPPVEVLQFINEHRQLDLSNFYLKLKKNYNSKKSKLYKNIVKEIEEPNEVLVTLSALLTQIILFANCVEDRQMFLKSARAEEITKVLDSYFTTYNIMNCVKLLKLVKADLKVIEYINK